MLGQAIEYSSQFLLKLDAATGEHNHLRRNCTLGNRLRGDQRGRN